MIANIQSYSLWLLDALSSAVQRKVCQKPWFRPRGSFVSLTPLRILLLSLSCGPSAEAPSNGPRRPATAPESPPVA